ncbi:peptide deformylase [Pseudochelatococcus lubricantis]|uniref:Peptide deformylase n=1 Tax=Pseudochelatococcus lubricantis TaxID=1538102 RepID=A0ABX0V4D4_9HYPH|nr:peptide deformylase [Pseudochelatococcus lubricantis]NIJ59384.1 peptide deformylase [Pseudochelatococcus lubricantis]
MTILPILVLPDPRLRLVSKPVEAVTDDIRTLVADMFETMYDAPGIGLAAIQVGVPKRLLVVDVGSREEERQPMTVINPEIVWESDDEFRVHQEGCLSIPEYYEEVERPARVRVRYMDLDGATREIEADGLLATCLQHEIDHLNGVLFIDHLSRLKRERVSRKFAKAAKHAGRAGGEGEHTEA